MPNQNNSNKKFRVVLNFNGCEIQKCCLQKSKARHNNPMAKTFHLSCGKCIK